MDLPLPVVLAKMDDGDEENRRLRAGADDMYNFTSYPSLFVLHSGSHERYGGSRDADGIVFHMAAVARGLDPYEEEIKTRPGLYKSVREFRDVVKDLEEEEDFVTTIVDDPTNVLRVVEWYSDRCPFCKSLAPEYVDASLSLLSAFPGKVEFHAVNSRVFFTLAESQGITGYPWLCFFYKGVKVEDMAGLGGADSIVRWVTKMVEGNWIESSADDLVAIAAWSAKTEAGSSEGSCTGGGGGGNGNGVPVFDGEVYRENPEKYKEAVAVLVREVLTQ